MLSHPHQRFFQRRRAGRYGVINSLAKFVCNFFAGKSKLMKEIFRMTGLMNEGRLHACFQSLL
jgi:hypothetical protein